MATKPKIAIEIKDIRTMAEKSFIKVNIYQIFKKSTWTPDNTIYGIVSDLINRS